jgi:hypothetical protein
MAQLRDVSFCVGSAVPLPVEFSTDMTEMMVYTPGGESLGTVGSIFFSRWNEGNFPTEAGVHDRVPLLEDPCAISKDGAMWEAKIYATLDVMHARYRGSLTPEQAAVLNGEGDPETPMPDIVSEWEALAEDATEPEAEIQFRVIAHYQ